MIIHKILGNTAFWMVNKHIAQKVGIESAILLADLIDKQLYFFNRDELDSDGYFFNTSDDILKSTTLTYHIQKKCLKNLTESEFVETKLTGVPAKLHFKVVENKILKFLNTEIQNVQKQELKKVETNNNKSNNNKSNNINNPDLKIEFPELIDFPTAVLEYLNDVRDSKIGFSATASNLSDIKARIKEKFTMEDFKKVIDHKNNQWKNDSKMSKYIRPSTLFGSKFNEYLVEAEIKVTSSDGSQNFKFNPQQKADLK